MSTKRCFTLPINMTIMGPVPFLLGGGGDTIFCQFAQFAKLHQPGKKKKGHAHFLFISMKFCPNHLNLYLGVGGGGGGRGTVPPQSHMPMINIKYINAV